MPSKIRAEARRTPRQARSRATVDAVLDATAQVLVEVGYARCSTNRVAEAAGVSIGSLYQYFPSKEILIQAVIERHLASLREAMISSFAEVRSHSLADTTAALIEGLVRAHARAPELHRIVLQDIPRSVRMAKVRDWEQSLHRAVVMLLEQRKAELRVKDLELAAFVVVVVVDALTAASLLYRHFPQRAVFASMQDLLLRYLAT
jgi:AcrR family transcriptional regulator